MSPEDGMAVLAKWAARQPDPAEAGGKVTYMLYKAALIHRDGTSEQKELAAQAAHAMRYGPRGALAEAIDAVIVRFDEIMP